MVKVSNLGQAVAGTVFLEEAVASARTERQVEGISARERVLLEL